MCGTWRGGGGKRRDDENERVNGEEDGVNVIAEVVNTGY